MPLNKFGDVAVVAILGAIIYLAFTPLFGQSESLVASETISAAASAILAAAFTWALLKRQSESAKENTFLNKQVGVFSDELKDLAIHLNQYLNQKSVSGEDLKTIKLRIMQTQLSLEVVSHEEVAKDLRGILEDIQNQIEDDRSDYLDFVQNKLFNSLLITAAHCRRQLLIPGLDYKKIEEIERDYSPKPKEQYDVNSRRSRDTTKYMVNGQGPLSKRKAALEIVKLVVEERKPTSYEQLKELFPDESYRSYNINDTGGTAIDKERRSAVNTVKFAKDIVERTGVARHWLDQEDLLKLGSDQAAVSNQWGENFKPFLDEFIKKKYPKVREKIKEITK